MRKIFPLVLTGSFILILTSLTSCKDDEDEVKPPPVISSFTPEEGQEGTTVTIAGENFSTVAAEHVVKFNNLAASITSASATSIVVTVPVGATTGKITVEAGGQTATSVNDFTVLPIVVLPANVWQAIADFGGVGRDNVGIAFVINGKAYTGGAGQDAGNASLKDFWEYNPQTNAWTQKADFGGAARNAAAGFAIGSKGYVGTGYNEGSYFKDFWEYNPQTNAWIQKADFEGAARDAAASFSIGTKGYLGTGIGVGTANYLSDFWEYDPTKDDWIQKVDFGGGARGFSTSFVIGTKGYIGFGQGTSDKKSFWEYDPASDTWTRKADYPTTTRNGQGFSIGTKAYVRGGASTKELWQYNATTNTWVQKADFPEEINSNVAFTIGNVGYMGLGTWASGPSKRFYKYIPD